MSKNSKLSRRDFLKTASAASVGIGAALSNVRPATARPRATQNSTVGIGIIGTGSRAKHLMQVLNTVPGVRYTGLCDIYYKNLKKARTLTGNEKTPIYADYHDLLASSDVDAVIVATPLHLHAEMSMAALRAGKDVFCEKTMARTVEECRQVPRVAEETGQLFQVGHQRRYSKLYQKVLRLIQDGAIGQLTTIQTQWHRNTSWRRSIPGKMPKNIPDDWKGLVTKGQLEKHINWRLYRDTSGGLMTELATHQLHVTNWFLDAVPQSVVGIGGIDYYKDGREVYDNVSCIYTYPNGVRLLYSSITTNKFQGCSELIMGTEGTIEIDLSSAKIYLEAKVRRSEFAKFVMDLERQVFNSVAVGSASFLPEDPSKDKGTRIEVANMEHSETFYELEHFVNSVRSRGNILCDAKEGMNAAIAAHMGNRAMDTQEVVVWPDGDGFA